MLGHLPDEVKYKIAIGNAARAYNFAPADPEGRLCHHFPRRRGSIAKDLFGRDSCWQIHPE
jgi:hypothetical protein